MSERHKRFIRCSVVGSDCFVAVAMHLVCGFAGLSLDGEIQGG